MRIIGTPLILGLLGALAGCNTVKGFGQDVQTGGAALTGTAESVEQRL